MVVGHYEVDNKTGRGVAELRTAIAEHVARLPQMGQLASPRWAATRDEVVARGKAEPQIDYHDFVRYAIGMAWSATILAIANFLHDIGQFIYLW